MNIRIVSVGKIKEKYLKQGISEYLKRISRYSKIEVVEVGDEKATEDLSPAQEEQVKQKEGDRVLNVIRENSVAIVLDLRGKAMTSEEFAKTIDGYAIKGSSSLDFVIGGSLGLDSRVVKRADLLLSFSSFTFPHQLMRLILLEQIYRAFRIIKGEP